MPGTSHSGGRNKKSKAAHIAAGTFQPSRHNGVALNAPEGVPPKPESLTGMASDEWDRMVERLMATSTLAPSDGPCMLHYCELAALATRLPSELDELPSLQYPKLVAGGASCEQRITANRSSLDRCRGEPCRMVVWLPCPLVGTQSYAVSAHTPDRTSCRSV